MQARKLWPLTLAALALFLTLAACGGNDAPPASDEPTAPVSEVPGPAQAQPGPIEVGLAAPDFTATLVDGSSFTLSEQQGKVVLLNFWATWCGPCVREMPAFTRLVDTYGDQLALLAVNSGESEQTVQDFLDEKGYAFPVAADPDWAVGELYPTDSIPYTVIIAPDGTIAGIQLGAADADAMFDHYCQEIDKVLP